MKFMAKYGRGFANEGEVYEAPVVARKFNGYMVQTDSVDDPIWFVCNDDFDILQISEQEKALPIAF